MRVKYRLQKRIEYDGGEYVIDYHFEKGSLSNHLPLNRKHLIIVHNSGNIIIENMWDLLPTASMNWYDINRDDTLLSYVLSSLERTSLAMFNDKRYMVANSELDNVYMCAIWSIEDDEVDFIIQPKTYDKVNRLLLSDDVLTKYGEAVLKIKWHRTT